MPVSTLKAQFLRLPDNLKGALTILVAAAGFSLMTVFIKLAGDRLHVTQILLIRQIIMTIIVAPAIVHDFPGVLRTNNPALQVVRVIGALVAMLCGFTAVIHMPLADVTAIGFAKSFFVTLFAIIILKETVGPRRWVAVAVGFFGVLLMMRPGGTSFNLYGAYALIGAISAGFVMVIIRKMSKTDAPVTILTYQAVLVGIIIAIPGIYYWKFPTLVEWLLLLGVGVISYIAQMLNIWAYKWGEASLLASLDYARLLYATIFGYFIFATLPDIYTWIGAGIIIGASIYTIWRERVRQQELARSPHGRGFTQQ